MQPISTKRIKAKWIISAYIIPIVTTIALVVIAIMLYKINKNIELLQAIVN